jgi:hypothetical protein
VQPVVLFADVEAWAVAYLSAGLTARPEPYAAGVRVSISVPTTMPPRLVTVRRDGGPQTSVVTEVARLGINVWATSDADVTGLTQLVRALLTASPGNGPVRRATSTGQSSLPDEPPHRRRYFTAELTLRALTS